MWPLDGIVKVDIIPIYISKILHSPYLKKIRSVVQCETNIKLKIYSKYILNLKLHVKLKHTY